MRIRSLSVSSVQIAITCLVAVAFYSHAAGQGLLLVKQYGWSAPSSATPVEYQSIERFSTVYNITTNQGAAKRITSQLIVEDIPYSSLALPSEIVSEFDRDALTEKISRLESVLAKHASTKTYLTPYLERLKSAEKNWLAGQVFHEAQWIPKSTYENRLQAQTAAMKQNEQRLIDEQNRKKEAKIAAEQEAKLAEEKKRQEDIDLEKRRIESQIDIEKRRIESQERIRLAELEAKKASEQRAAAELEERRKKQAEKAEQEEQKVRDLREKHTKYVAKYLNDNFVKPSDIAETASPTYEETISFINGKIGKLQNWIGFGKNSQRFVFVAPEYVAVFNASDFPPEAQISSQPSSEGLRNFVTIEVRNSESLVEYIKLLPVSDDEVAASQFGHQLSIEVENKTDAEKLKKAFNHLIGMFGGKKELF